MKKQYVVVHANSELPGYWGEAPQLPGCFSRGNTVEELLTNAREAIELYLEDSDMEGTDILDVRELVV